MKCKAASIQSTYILIKTASILKGRQHRSKMRLTKTRTGEGASLGWSRRNGERVNRSDLSFRRHDRDYGCPERCRFIDGIPIAGETSDGLVPIHLHLRRLSFFIRSSCERETGSPATEFQAFLQKRIPSPRLGTWNRPCRVLRATYFRRAIFCQRSHCVAESL